MQTESSPMERARRMTEARRRGAGLARLAAVLAIALAAAGPAGAQSRTDGPSGAADGPPGVAGTHGGAMGLVLGPNIRITNDADPQNETSIAVDPTDPQIVIAGFNDYRLGGSFAGNGVAISTDAGATWTDLGPAVLQPTGFEDRGGDPGIAFDSTGRAFYSHIASASGASIFTRNNGVFVASSTDGGASWGTTVAVQANNWPGSGTVPFEDKCFVAADEYPASTWTDRVYVSWTRFYDQTHPADGLDGGGDILFSFSSDGGATWSASSVVSSPTLQPTNGGTGTPGRTFVQGSEPEVAANGDVYVVYKFTDRADVHRSTDGGVTFGMPTQPFGAAAGAMDVDSPLPGMNFRVNPFPNIETDPTRPGNVYVCSVTDPDGIGVGTDGGDVIFARSTDDGATWDPTLTLNDDGLGSNQIFPWMAVDPDSGDICVIWYDARNDPNNHDIDVYGAFSFDGGVTWCRNQRITSQSFDPDTGQFNSDSFFGDYNGIAAGGGRFHMLWTDARDGDQEIYYASKSIQPSSCDPRSQGFWKRQCKKPHPSGEHGNLPLYIPTVNATATFAWVSTVEDICSVMWTPPPRNDPCDKAETQFMALLLNIASGRIDEGCCVGSDLCSSDTVGQVVADIDALLSDPNRSRRDCKDAQAMADAINSGDGLCRTSSPLRRGHDGGSGGGWQPFPACGGMVAAPSGLGDLLGWMLPWLLPFLALGGLRLVRRRRAAAIA